MTQKPKILAFAGSTRSDSVNKKLVNIAASGAEAAGAEVTTIDLHDYPMPIYDGDLEAKEGIPENGKKFKEFLKSHDGFLIASPEYNSSISAALKNAIDWASRPEEGEGPLAAFVGKVAGIMSASPGGLGGMRGLVHLRSILGNIQVLVIPDQITIPNAFEAFSEDGLLTDSTKNDKVQGLGKKVAEIASKLGR